MIDFKDELSKYKPALLVEEIESAVQTDEIQDIKELLLYITEKLSMK